MQLEQKNFMRYSIKSFTNVEVCCVHIDTIVKRLKKKVTIIGGAAALLIIGRGTWLTQARPTLMSHVAGNVCRLFCHYMVFKWASQL